MKETINRCIVEMKEKSKIKGAQGYEVKRPKNPSIIVNYNLENKKAEQYYAYLEQLWPSVYHNFPKMEVDGSSGEKMNEEFYETENEVRGNEIFQDFSQIYIHILVDITVCDEQKLKCFLEESSFFGPSYKIILHEFLNYEISGEIENTEKKLLQLMKNKKKINYQFVYSNRLYNGGMWIKENALKLLRLAANVTAIMSIDSHYFSDGTAYTFSYNLLEKPTRKIVQFTILRLLEKMRDYADEENKNLDQEIANRFQNPIRNVTGTKAVNCGFHEKDFKYLPSNSELQREKTDVNKDLLTLERNYPQAAACYRAMIKQRCENKDSISVKDLDFAKEIQTELLSYYRINSFLKNNRHEEELMQKLEERLLHEREISGIGTYGKVLAEYANQKMEMMLVKPVLETFKERLFDKIERARNINEWILDYAGSGELQINAIEKEEKLISYYGNLIDYFWNNNRETIIARIDGCGTQEELLENGIVPTLKDLFDNIDIYYKSFEDEIDERVGNNTAKAMFDRISEEDNVTRNICLTSALEFWLEIKRTGESILLIKPESKLLHMQDRDNYKTLELNRQDCVERIDFHTLSLKEEYDGN